jgi:S-adenosylmethionine hydrolase
MNRPLIALLTDFGLEDTYVGVMKGVIKTICPEAEPVDLCHGVRRQGVAEAAFLLATSHAHFPPGTVFLCVVDPGVGSDRAALAVASGRHLFVAPDNGLLSLVWRRDPESVAHAITSPDHRLAKVSTTFHGRDIFAPAAAHLAAGVPLHDLGPRMPDIEQLAFAHPLREGAETLAGAVLHVDHFGNVITNIRPGDLPHGADPATLEVVIGKHALGGLHDTYSAVASGDALVHWGSSDFLEIAVREGDAADRFGLGVGDAVRVRWQS